MKLTLSTKGQVVLPLAVRNKYRLQAGDSLEVQLEDSQIRLIPTPIKKRKGRIVKNPITGLPCVTFGPDAPRITKEMVDKLLEDFP